MTKSVISELGKIKHKVKSKNVSKSRTELTVEVYLSGNNTTFVDRISSLDGVESAVLVSYSGDYVE